MEKEQIKDIIKDAVEKNTLKKIVFFKAARQGHCKMRLRAVYEKGRALFSVRKLYQGQQGFTQKHSS